MMHKEQNSYDTLPQILAGNSSKYGGAKNAIRDKAFCIWQK
jgi:hypothetical protein